MPQSELASIEKGEVTMAEKHGASKEHHHHEKTHHCHHHHGESDEKGPALSAREKLIMRLEHYIRHNNEHATSFKQLADAAAHSGDKEASEEIRAALETIALQNEHLEKALLLLKSS